VADDLVLNVKQIAQYPLTPSVGTGDVTLIQKGGLGGPYNSMLPTDLVGSALALLDIVQLAAGSALAWNGASLASDGISFSFTGDVHVPSLHSDGDIFVAGNALATQLNVDQLFDTIIANSVFTVNGRNGNVILETDDILRAGGAPIADAHLGGFNTSPTPWDFRSSNDQIATTAFVQGVVEQVLCGGSVVTSFNGRGGDVVLTTADVNAAYAAGAVAAPPLYPTAPNPALGDASSRIATTLFVDDSLTDLQQQMLNFIASGGGIDLSAYAPLASPNFSGIPTAPTAATGVSTGQLATTAFVHNAVTAATTGVASFNTRTGAVVLLAADVTGVGGALVSSPALVGNPTAPTAALHNSSTTLATTAYVQGELAALPTAPVTSFNTRTGAIVLNTADVTSAGGAPLANPTFSGTPAGPTAAPGTNSTALATTAFVTAALAAFSGGVASFNSRTGLVTLIANDISAAGGALLAGPAFTGAPSAPTATLGTSSTQLATTAFVQAAITAMAAGVTSFNGRSGIVTLTTADITGAGGAPLASPGLTGAPTAPTAAQTSNDTTLATTAYVRAALAAAPGGVSSFNSRTGAITLIAADVSAVGGALLASPSFSGVPTAPTPVVTDNSTTLATTAFVSSKIAAAGGVNSFNGRAGVVVLSAADLTSAGGALLASPSFSGVPLAPTAAPGTATTQLATTAFAAAAAAPTSGNKILLSTVTVSTAVASVSFFTGFDGTYDELELRTLDVLPATEGQPLLRFSTDGSTFDAGTSYITVYNQTTSSPANTITAASASAAAFVYLGPAIGTNVRDPGHMVITMRVPTTANPAFEVFWQGAWQNSLTVARVTGAGFYGVASPVKGVQFFFSAINITRGTFKLYGIVK
jgi:hypothetical protein